MFSKWTAKKPLRIGQFHGKNNLSIGKNARGKQKISFKEKGGVLMEIELQT